MRSRLRLIILSLSVFFSWQVKAEINKYTAVLYKQGSKKAEKLYNLKVETTPVTPEGKSEVTAVYSDLEGQILVEEKSQLEGSKLLKYQVDHKQSGQKGSVEVKDNKVYFSHTQDGKTKTAEESLKSTLVISGNFSRFVKDHWDQVKAGKDVGFRYAAWQRRETVGFEIFKIGEEKINGEDAIVVKMKPSSFIIAALVKPLLFKYSAEGARLLELNGRVPPMEKKGGDFKDLDAEVVYSY